MKGRRLRLARVRPQRGTRGFSRCRIRSEPGRIAAARYGRRTWMRVSRSRKGADLRWRGRSQYRTGLTRLEGLNRIGTPVIRKGNEMRTEGRSLRRPSRRPRSWVCGVFAHFALGLYFEVDWKMRGIGIIGGGGSPIIEVSKLLVCGWLRERWGLSAMDAMGRFWMKHEDLTARGVDGVSGVFAHFARNTGEGFVWNV